MSLISIRIGSRGSALALKQVEIVSQALKVLDSSIEVQVKVIQTQGDVNFSPIPMDVVGKGWFTKEIEQALLKDEIDLAVHSLKDMAEEMPDGLKVGAYLSREEAWDALITKGGEKFEELRKGAIIGTDSVRRRVQLLSLRPDLKVESLRGNVQTRLSKLETGNYDAIILAAAGLKRLGLGERITRCFELSEMTPAPGQGILAVQCRNGDSAIEALLAKLNDPATAKIARIERSFSKTVGGGCKAPTGAYATYDGKQYHLTAMIAGEDGAVFRESASVEVAESDSLGKLVAEKLLARRDHEKYT